MVTCMSEIVSGEGPPRILITSRIHPHSADSRSFVSCIQVCTTHAGLCGQNISQLSTLVYTCTSLYMQPCANKWKFLLSRNNQQRTNQCFVVAATCALLHVASVILVWPLKEFHSIIIEVRLYKVLFSSCPHLIIGLTSKDARDNLLFFSSFYFQSSC